VSAETNLRVAPGRRVSLDAERGIVTKRFRDARPGWRARQRAKQEERVLRALGARGAAVPAWLGTDRQADGTICVHLAAIPRATTVLENLTPTGPNPLMGAVGELLASLHNAGLDQPDLHAKNALVDPDGKVWAIDFHQARMRAELGPEVLLRDLVKLCGAHRETLSLRARQRFLVAWWRGLGPGLRENLPNRSLLAASVEDRGRRARQITCAGYAKPTSRFFRISSTMRAATAEEAARLAGDPGAHADPAGAPLGDDRLLIRADAPEAHVDAALGSGETDARFLHLRGPHAAVEAQFGQAARLLSHALPGARPLVLDRRGPKAHAILDWQAPWGLVTEADACSELSLPPTERAELDAALIFRGLTLRAPAPSQFRSARGCLLLAPSAKLVTADQWEALNQANQKRRARRALWLAWWPRLCAAPMRPVTAVIAQTAARAARWSPLETRLRAHLKRGLPDRDPAELTPKVRAHLAHLFVEWGQMGQPGWSELLLERVRPDASYGRIETHLHQGGLVVTPHLGNWEWLAAFLLHHGLAPGKGINGAVVGRIRRNDPVAHFLKGQRARAGVETLAQDTHPRELLRRIQSGTLLGILPDLEVSRLAGTRMPFLGREALVMTAPAALARASRRPLLPAACIRQPDGSYTLTFGDPIAAPRDKQSTNAVTAEWIAVFEDWIRAHPEQWLWLNDRWSSAESPGDQVPLSSLRAAQKASSRP
jgi:lauroyl/myristoyl acyltransferase/tRNA A-37 threonylcarbamoyl transferase component Bud32